MTGVRAGWAIEPRNQVIRGADAFQLAEGEIAGGVIASGRRTPRGRRTWACTEVSMRENREIPRSPVCGDASSWMVRGVAVGGAGREGNAKAVIPRCTSAGSQTVP